MKKLVCITIAMFILFYGYSQNKITGTSSYFPEDDSISISVTELNYLIARSMQVCTKIDTLDDGAMIKTVEIQSRDTIFRFIGAYLESEPFFSHDIRSSMESKPRKLKCSIALVGNGELYETYQLNATGRKYFERILNKTSLVCIDPYQWRIWAPQYLRSFFLLNYFHDSISWRLLYMKNEVWKK